MESEFRTSSLDRVCGHSIGSPQRCYPRVMTDSPDRAKKFLDLHRKGDPLLLANAWDVGSARLLASLGFEALATTSAGHAGTLGRLDGRVSRDEALAHAADLVAATPLPVNADLEHGIGPRLSEPNLRRRARTREVLKMRTCRPDRISGRV